MIYKEYALKEASAVDAISAEVQDYLNGLNTESRNVQRIRLTVEELLLNIIGHCGDGVTVSVGIGKQFGRQLFRLRYKWAPYDPTKSSDYPWSDDILRQLGYAPSWSYRGRINTVSITLVDRPKRSALFYIAAAVISALVLGLAGGHFPSAVCQGLIDILLAPFADAFLGLMTTFSGLMIAFTICSGMLGMSDSAAAGRMGQKVILRLIGLSFAISTATAAIIMPLLHLNLAGGGQGQTSGLMQISKLFFDILPSNIIDPFRQGNALQIITISVLVGAALLAIDELGSHVRVFVNETAVLMQRTISMICALVPLFIFAVLLRQIWSGEDRTFLSFLKPMLLTAVSVLIVAAVLWLISSLRLRCPPLLLIRKVFPPFLTALTTASSVSAMTLGMETCEKKLGIKKSTVSFVYPLGSVLYMPATVAYFTVLAFACAEFYQVEVSLSWLIIAVIVSTLIVIALPPIPGAAMLGFTVLFSSLSIPLDALIIATATNIIFDFFDTGFNVLLLILQLACESKSAGKLDRGILLNR